MQACEPKAAAMVLDVDQVAALMRCTPETVQDYARRGELTGLKWGRDWVFPVGALMRRLDEMAEQEASKRRPPTSPPAAAVLHANVVRMKPERTRGARTPPPLPSLDLLKKDPHP